MKLTDTQFIAAPPEAVYAALNDADTLRQCIPGCDTLEKKSDTELSAAITLKIGPVKATFNGDVTLSNLNPPHGYTITGQGSGGAAGHARGGADVSLAAADGGTQLTYAVEAQISGKIAQLGARLIDSTAKKLAAQFFENLAACLAPAEAAEDGGGDKADDKTDSGTSAGNTRLLQYGIAAVVAIALLLYLAFR